MSVTRARLLCLSTLTTLAHITFSVGILHTTVQEICTVLLANSTGVQYMEYLLLSLWPMLIGWACFLLTFRLRGMDAEGNRRRGQEGRLPLISDVRQLTGG